MRVKVISTSGKAALVEWIIEKSVYRGTVPLDKVLSGVVDRDVLAMAVPYGEPWEEIELETSGTVLAQELRRRGIWTAEDLFANGQAAQAAIRAAIGLDVSKLMLFAKRARRGNYD